MSAVLGVPHHYDGGAVRYEVECGAPFGRIDFPRPPRTVYVALPIIRHHLTERVAKRRAFLASATGTLDWTDGRLHEDLEILNWLDELERSTP